MYQLTERLGAKVLGATVYEMKAGETRGPYHYHDGVEEWMYVVSGAPILRDHSGERTVEQLGRGGHNEHAGQHQAARTSEDCDHDR